MRYNFNGKNLNIPNEEIEKSMKLFGISENDAIEMGYVIAPAYQNQGYATEAFGAVIAHLFSRGFREVIAGAFAENLSSIRVMEKCGMQRIAKKADIEYRGKLHHCVYYSIKAD